MCAHLEVYPHHSRPEQEEEQLEVCHVAEESDARLLTKVGGKGIKILRRNASIDYIVATPKLYS